MPKYKQNNSFQPEDVGASKKLMSDRPVEKDEPDAIRYKHHNRLTPRGIVILCALGLVLILLLLYFVPWPTHVQLALPGAELAEDGTVIAEGEMVIEGWIYHYLFKSDEFHVGTLRIPNREIGQVTETGIDVLFYSEHNDFYYTFVDVELPEYTSPDNIYMGTLCFAPDHTSWAFQVTDRIFVGTTSTNANYENIMNTLGKYIG